MRIIKAVFITVLLIMSNCIIAAGSPVAALENASGNLLNTLKSHKAELKSNPQIIKNAVHTHLVPLVDVVGMARSVLGRDAWKNASPAEKKQFSQAFLQLVIRTYANPLSEYNGETIKFLPVNNLNEKFIKVKSIVMRTNGQKIPVTYSLVMRDGQWKIYDFSVEGVSLLQSFRSQFAQALKNSSMGDLIRQMQKKEVA